MREHRPVIALDFPSFEAVKKFLALFPEEESNRNQTSQRSPRR